MHSNIHLIIIAVVVTLGICLAVHILRLRQATSTANQRGYTSGYSAAINARQPLLDELQRSINEQAVEITSLKGQRLTLVRDHQHALEAIGQDADNRVKLYAQRRLSDHELLWVRRAIKQLERAIETHTLLGNSQRARDTSATREQLQALVSRLEQTEAATQAPARIVRSVIVFGPEACGKTRNASRIAKALGLTTIVDGWHPDQSGQKLNKQNTLYLTNHLGPFDSHLRSVITYDEAMQRVTEQEAAA